MQAVILAGGKGTRLKPFTINFPKPLVPIDDLPILEIVLKQLKYYGFNNIILAVNHLSELLMAFFGNGEKLGLNISYSIEDKVLGTAGPLSIIDSLEENFIVMNGDILTTLNFDDLFKFHLKSKNDVTISIYKKNVKIDLGVLEMKNDQLMDYIEKPVHYFNVSMGIYVFNKSIVKLIPKNNKKYDLPDLIRNLLKLKKKVKCYSGNYYWLDIGRIEDYEKANDIFNKKKKEFLPNG